MGVVTLVVLPRNSIRPDYPNKMTVGHLSRFVRHPTKNEGYSI